MAIRVFPLTGVPKVNVGPYAPRHYPDGTTKLHDAVDLGAGEGTPVVAVDDGTISWSSDVKGGNVAVLHLADGSAIYYAHLRDPQSGSHAVKVGQQIGLVGETGNAQGTTPHTHFQVWPTGQFIPGSVHPDPTADLWAAPVLAAPAGGPSRSWRTWALVAAAVASAAGIGALAWEELRHPGAVLPWRTA